jgi:uncharacterized membrane protein YfcA
MSKVVSIAALCAGLLCVGLCGIAYSQTKPGESVEPMFLTIVGLGVFFTGLGVAGLVIKRPAALPSQSATFTKQPVPQLPLWSRIVIVAVVFIGAFVGVFGAARLRAYWLIGINGLAVVTILFVFVRQWRRRNADSSDG